LELARLDKRLAQLILMGRLLAQQYNRVIVTQTESLILLAQHAGLEEIATRLELRFILLLIVTNKLAKLAGFGAHGSRLEL
jgi:hypothetical protein